MLIAEYTVPSYALPYLVNGDTSGMEPDEVAMIDKWAEAHISSMSHISVGEEFGFSTRPAFGLPCDCTVCEVVTV